MKIFTIFFGQNLSKNILQNAPNCTIFLKFSRGACPQTPLANAWLRHTLHGANRLQKLQIHTYHIEKENIF